jgi:O-antigen/teichoic acid export membrane protein
MSSSSSGAEGEAGPSAGSLQREALRGSLWTVASTVLGVPLALLALVVAGRILGPAGFGQYSLYSFAIPVLLMLVDFGMAASFTWSATAGRAAEDGSTQPALRATVTWNALKLPVVWVVALVAMSDEPAAAVVLAMCLTVFLMSQGLATAVTASRGYAALSASAFLNTAVAAVGVIVACVITDSPEWAAAAFWGGRVASVPVLWVKSPRELRGAAVTPGSLRLDRRSWRFGLSSHVAALLDTWVFGRSELLFLGRVGATTAQGQFAVASTIGQRATIVADAVYGALGIAMVALRSTEPDRFAEAFSRAIRLTTLLAVVTATVVTVPAALLAGPVFGGEYGEVAEASAILLVLALLRTTLQPLLSWVFTERVSRALIVPGICAAALDIGLCLLLIPQAALLGAVVANAASTVTFLVLTTATAGLPPAGLEAVYQCAARFGAVGVVNFAIVLLPLEMPLLAEIALATTIAWLISVPLARAFPPLLAPEQVQSIQAGMPRRLALLFRWAIACFNGR